MSFQLLNEWFEQAGHKLILHWNRSNNTFWSFCVLTIAVLPIGSVSNRFRRTIKMPIPMWYYEWLSCLSLIQTDVLYGTPPLRRGPTFAMLIEFRVLIFAIWKFTERLGLTSCLINSFLSNPLLASTDISNIYYGHRSNVPFSVYSPSKFGL